MSEDPRRAAENFSTPQSLGGRVAGHTVKEVRPTASGAENRIVDRTSGRQQSSLFTYGTDISLRGPERRAARLPLLLMLVVTAALAAVVLAGVVWLATADVSGLVASLRDMLLAAMPRV